MIEFLLLRLWIGDLAWYVVGVCSILSSFWVLCRVHYYENKKYWSINNPPNWWFSIMTIVVPFAGFLATVSTYGFGPIQIPIKGVTYR